MLFGGSSGGGDYLGRSQICCLASLVGKYSHLIFFYVFLSCDLEFLLCCYWIVGMFLFMGGSLNIRVFWYCCSLRVALRLAHGKIEGNKQKKKELRS